jgi:hypothetical protein
VPHLKKFWRRLTQAQPGTLWPLTKHLKTVAFTPQQKNFDVPEPYF